MRWGRLVRGFKKSSSEECIFFCRTFKFSEQSATVSWPKTEESSCRISFTVGKTKTSCNCDYQVTTVTSSSFPGGFVTHRIVSSYICKCVTDKRLAWGPWPLCLQYNIGQTDTKQPQQPPSRLQLTGYYSRLVSYVANMH